ncbi:transposase family protein [Streptomyces asiaticus]
MSGLLERLAQVPDPRDPRGVRHALAVVVALTACAVLAGATSLLAVGEWIADAPLQVLERLGVRDLLRTGSSRHHSTRTSSPTGLWVDPLGRIWLSRNLLQAGSSVRVSRSCRQ